MKSNWSRRELYALGETLGDCVTERKLGGGYICGGGGKGGGGGTPSQTTAYQTNLPEYAKPYVTTMLEATQKQLFNTRDVPGVYDPNTGTTSPGTTEITGFKPYTPYSSDPTKYFAGPSSLQTMGYNEAAGMTTPTQFAPATGLAQAAGMGQLGTALQGQMLGRQGMGIGQMGMAGAMPAFQAGQQYAQGVTDPSQIGAYMSPYQQQVTDVAKAAAVREAQLADKAARLGSVRQGTYGGAREILGRTERERNLLANLSNIQAQGSQSAYDRAIQNMQYGSNLGLQGIQTGLQGISAGQQGVSQGLAGLGAQQAAYGGAGQLASTLGGLGTAEQQADISRIGLQQQLGSAQQQYQQNIINQAIQDYATAQQYPMMQLGFMSNMLRGLPLQATTTQSYMPTPNLTTQAIAGLGTAAGAYKAFGMKAGGKVPSYAGPEGSEVEMGMKAKLEALASTDAGLAQVARIAETSPSVEMRKLANQVLIEKRTEDQAAAQAEASIAQDQAPKGLAAAPAPVMDTLGAAGGGIVAFADEGEVVYDPTKVYGDPYKMMSDVQLIERDKKRRELLGIGDVVTPEYREYLAKQKEGSKAYEDRLAGLTMMKTFARMNKPGDTLNAVLGGVGESTGDIADMYEKVRGREAEIAKGMQDIYGKERTDKLGILTGIEKDQDEIRKALGERERARLAHSQRTTDLMQVYQIELAALKAQNKDPRDPRVQKEAMDNAQRIYGGKGAAQDARDFAAITGAKKADPQIGEKGTLTKELNLLKLMTPPKDPEKLSKHNAKIEALEDKIAERELIIERRLSNRQQSGGAAPINVDNLPPKN